MRRMTGLTSLLLAVGGPLLGGCPIGDEGYWVSRDPVYSRNVEVNEYRTINPHGLAVVYDPGVMRYSVVGCPGLYGHDGYYSAIPAVIGGVARGMTGLGWCTDTSRRGSSSRRRSPSAGSWRRRSIPAAGRGTEA